MLEPCDGKLSRRVLRGERGGNAPDLPVAMSSIKEKTGFLIRNKMEVAHERSGV